MTKLLLIDDDPMLTDPLARSLTQAGYTALVAGDGQSGLDMALKEGPDVVVLDVMMPVMDGWEVCRQLRAESPVPILMLTALDDEVDRVLGLELGADDYLTKPFSTRELIARVRALLRRVELDRAETESEGEMKIGDIRLLHEARRAYKGNEELALRYKEFELLTLLMSRKGQVVTRADLFDIVWGTDWLGDTRTLDVHIRWLREKIEDDPSAPLYLHTVRGVGYHFVAPDEAPA